MKDVEAQISEWQREKFYRGAHGELTFLDDPETAGPFVIGNMYQTTGGRWVRIDGVANKGTDHETVYDHMGHHRYSNPDSGRLCGRCTGTSRYSPDNIDIIGKIKEWNEKHPNSPD